MSKKYDLAYKNTSEIDIDTAITSAEWVLMVGADYAPQRITRANFFLGGAVNMHPAATDYGLKVHTHLNSTEWGNEFKGEFVATSGTMDGIAAHYHMAASGTGVMRSVLAVAYLDTGVTLSGTLSTTSWIAGSLSSVNVAGVINGTSVHVLGAYAGLGSMVGGTLTACQHMAALMVDSQVTQVPTSGESSLIYMNNGVGATLKNGIYVDANERITSLLTIYNPGVLVKTGTANGTCVQIKMNISGTPYYINAYPTQN